MCRRVGQRVWWEKREHGLQNGWEKAVQSKRVSRILTIASLQARARVAPLAVRTYATAKPGAFLTLFSPLHEVRTLTCPFPTFSRHSHDHPPPHTSTSSFGRLIPFFTEQLLPRFLLSSRAELLALLPAVTSRRLAVSLPLVTVSPVSTVSETSRPRKWLSSLPVSEACA